MLSRNNSTYNSFVIHRACPCNISHDRQHKNNTAAALHLVTFQFINKPLRATFHSTLFKTTSPLQRIQRRATQEPSTFCHPCEHRSSRDSCHLINRPTFHRASLRNFKYSKQSSADKTSISGSMSKISSFVYLYLRLREQANLFQQIKINTIFIKIS